MRTIETNLGVIELDAIPSPRLKMPVGARRLNPLEIELAGKAISSPKGTAIEAPTLINLNHAAKPVLVLLPGVGEKTAQKIIDARPLESFHSLVTVEVELNAEAKRLVSF